MKRKKDLYNNMLILDNIVETYNEIVRNTKNKRKIYKWESMKEILFSKVYKTLENRGYKAGKYSRFIIYEPKMRVINSQDMFDKLVNHLVSKYILLPSIEPCLINSNIASRKGKGTSYGHTLYYKYRNICNTKYEKYYLLKIDIYHFFASINREKLKLMLGKRIKEKDSIDILNEIIDSFDEGIPIGSQTSQLFAIFYLNDVDHYIKEVLKIKYYIRYQDDLILIHPDKQYLKYCLSEVEKRLNALDLKLNKKTKIYSNKENINYIGVRKNRKYSNISRTKRKYKTRNYEYRNNLCSLDTLVSSKISYISRKKGVK